MRTKLNNAQLKGWAITAAREYRGLRVGELAEHLGIHRNTMARIEAGERPVKQIELLGIASALNELGAPLVPLVGTAPPSPPRLSGAGNGGANTFSPRPPSARRRRTGAARGERAVDQVLRVERVQSPRPAISRPPRHHPCRRPVTLPMLEPRRPAIQRRYLYPQTFAAVILHPQMVVVG